MSEKKYYLGICSIILVNSLHVVFFDNDSKFDVYLFYEHQRYLTNILYDISYLYSFTLLSNWLCNFKRKIFYPLYIVSLASWLFYFAFYWQKASLFLIPFYLCIVIVPRLIRSKE